MFRVVYAIFFCLLVAGSNPLWAVPQGERLYTRHCAACHGEEGRGGVGIPLALPAFLTTASDEYLTRSIRLGRPGRIMPAFTDLSDEEIAAIVSHIRGWHPKAPEEEYARIRGTPERGEKLFRKHCVQCHGEQGEGGAGTGVTFSRPRDFSVIAPALNNSGFLAAASDRMIRETLILGREGTPMPSYRTLGLNDEDIDNLVAYIRSLETQAKARSAEPEMAATLVYESSYGLEETIENVKRAAIGRNFRIIREQPLNEGLVPEADNDTQRIMVYFCNFKFLDEVLKLDPRVGLFLPCRVTVVEQDGVVKVMSINPKRLSYLFNNDKLDAACEQMYELYEAILEESTL